VPFQVIPRERAFYGLLEEAAANVVVGTRALLDLVNDLPNGEEHRARVESIEHAGDDVTHRIMALLNTTFVTPFDRSDIHELASSLDDILDAAHAVADLLVLHKIDEPLPQFRQQCAILVDAAQTVADAIGGLRSLRASERVLVAITRLERDGDHVFRRGVAELYAGDYRAMDVLKWRDIHEQLEWAIDRCEDVANVVESILVKFS
jgi:predicted phosphate transport protein (TIGR00153 family)